jgi:hypothetical protein
MLHKYADIHLANYLAQPNIQFMCDKSWSVPKQNQPALHKLYKDIFLAENGYTYTFTESVVNCDACNKIKYLEDLYRD